jgi:translocation and assembly module TamA
MGTRGASEPVGDEALESFLDAGLPGLVCDDTRLVGATSFSATCLPTEGAPLLTVSGLEPMTEPLRGCVLTSLPVETGPGDPATCQQGAAQVLQGRLRQLGWLEAQVSRPQDSADMSQAQLSVRLGSRFQVGPLRVERTEGGGRVEPQKILAKAYAAVPEGAWYTSSTLAAMHARVFQMKKFRAVWVIGDEPDYQNKVVPVIIDVWEKPQKPHKPKAIRHEQARVPDHCPRRGSICFNGRDCTFDQRLGCTVCACRPACW